VLALAGHSHIRPQNGPLKRLLVDIHLETTDNRKLVLARVSRPDGEAKRILAALGLDVPERLSPDHVL
jgi:hypothetical protein